MLFKLLYNNFGDIQFIQSFIKFVCIKSTISYNYKLFLILIEYMDFNRRG